MLEEKLLNYSKSNAYPFHMPGHKRRLEFDNPYSVDITEIYGFDDLHSPKDILRDAQRYGAQIYGAKDSYFLVNGSTCGLLAAICAAAKKGERVLVARNCHKAVYHAIYLQELCPVYLYPGIADCGIQGQILPESVDKALEENPEVRAVILTSPTYDGVVSDVKAIAEIVHRRGISLIVDEAHGAHFGFHGYFPENAVSLGADAVIVSLHKTLPAFTQTALLHLCSGRIDPKKVRQYLDIFETSSPSYLLMAGIERCLRILAEDGWALFDEFSRRLEDFYARAKGLRRLHVLQREELSPREAYDFDPSKILILTGRAGISGEELQRILRQKYALETEMACANYTLALTTVMDTQEGFDRLTAALTEIDADLEAGSPEVVRGREAPGDASIYRRLERVMEIPEALCCDSREVSLSEAKGLVSGDYVYLYPPGIPLVVPGERIDALLLTDIGRCQRLGLKVEGLPGKDRIDVIPEPSGRNNL